MSGRIPREFIDDLLVRVDVVDLIDSHVPLKKAGNGRYAARCPFHSEKTPSFSVSRTKQFYHCFGCGVSGNAISFLMEFGHLDFVEAIEDLASFVGVDVPREAVAYRQEKQDYSELYSVLEQVAVFYVEKLKDVAQGVDAVAYLKKRGLSGEVAKEFSLGYAPNEWNALGARFNDKLLMDAGLLVKKEAGGSYDRFRGRLVFPIKDKRKRIIGFGARVLDDSLPKYLNSPETSIFSKGKELYGLSELLERNSKPKRIIIVEGYMDVLALAQFGIPYSVAALGTATSKIHLDLLFRFTSEVVFCFDGDAAGQKAAWRAVEAAFPCLKDGRQVRVMLMPGGQDPDSLVREQGVDGFEKLIEGAQALSDYFFSYVEKDVELKTVEGRSLLLAKAQPYIEKIPAGFFREMMFERLRRESSADTFSSSKDPVVPFSRGSVRKLRRSEHTNRVSPVRMVVALLLQNPELIDVFEQQSLDLSGMTFQGAETLIDVLQVIEDNKPSNSAVLMECFRDKPNEKLVSTLMKWDFFILDDGVAAEFVGAIHLMLKQVDEDRLDFLLKKEKEGGLSSAERLLLKKLLAK